MRLKVTLRLTINKSSTDPKCPQHTRTNPSGNASRSHERCRAAILCFIFSDSKETRLESRERKETPRNTRELKMNAFPCIEAGFLENCVASRNTCFILFYFILFYFFALIPLLRVFLLHSSTIIAAHVKRGFADGCKAKCVHPNNITMAMLCAFTSLYAVTRSFSREFR